MLGHYSKFLRIPDYRATVNCGVYYASSTWAAAMDRSFDAVVEQPNDELLWRSILPADVVEREEFWWNGRVVHVEGEQDDHLVARGTCFVHGKGVGRAGALKSRYDTVSLGCSGM